MKHFSLEHCDTFRPAIFDMAHSAHQLRCAGVLEAVRISRMAYPNRMPHASFVSRYALLAPSEWQAAHEVDMARARAAAPGDESARALCEGALALVVEDVARYQLGKTKVFFRAFLLEALEQRRSAELGIAAREGPLRRPTGRSNGRGRSAAHSSHWWLYCCAVRVL